MSEMEIPEGWIKSDNISDIISTLESGKRPKGGVRKISDGIPSIGGEHLKYDGKFNFVNIKFVPKDFFENMKQGKIQQNDILVVKDGATTGKTSFVDLEFPYDKASVNEHVFIIRPTNDLIPKFLFYYLRSTFAQKIILSKTNGVIGGINTNFVNDFPILYPKDKIIQEKIIHKLDYILEQLEEKIKEISQITIKNKNKINILNQNIDAYIIDAYLPSFNSSKNPIMKLDEICKKIVDPDHKMPLKVNDGIPLISTRDFTSEDEINFNSAKIISIQDYEHQIKRCKPEFDDILFSRYGTIGKAVKITTKNPFAMSYSLVLLKPNKEIITSDYLLLNLNSSRLQTHSIQGVRGAAIPDLGIKTIREFSIVVPSLDEQGKIIEKIHKKKLEVIKIKKHIEHTSMITRHIEKMLVHQKGIILNMAFSGKLVN